MASRLEFLASPYQLATLLLAIAACLFTVTTLPPSSTVYLIRADYNRGDATTLTAWFSPLGYCTSESSNEVLRHGRSDVIRCTGAVIGYDVERALERDGGNGGDGSGAAAASSASALSTMLTAGPAVMSPVVVALCLVGVAAYQAILRRPSGARFAVSMGASFLALLVAGVAFVFEHSLQSYIASGIPPSPSPSPSPAAAATFTTAYGPLSYAAALALLAQLAACVVGFYACIGGKYQCEGAIQLGGGEEEEEEDFASGARAAGQGVIGGRCSALGEKFCPL
ncbi:hypothetical protein SAMD00023353_2900410 [Rosellinia necatrix]|uniref:Uncharacterized protein n=1 Tax=Rosellinia necatrix TaxID=77044 RepID=A0A1W2TJH9_ROSNE|nr:hypothetical protein SAMD00023353_2900410 [Rosellinia necatrix]